MRVFYLIAYLSYLIGQVLLGSWNVVRATLSPKGFGSPAIIEFPLRCSTDLEIAVLASSITITPGTLVLGVAAGLGESPPTLFVHSMFDDDRASVLSGLRDMESRMLCGLRGRKAS